VRGWVIFLLGLERGSERPGGAPFKTSFDLIAQLSGHALLAVIESTGFNPRYR